jgi:hypothetical protein
MPSTRYTVRLPAPLDLAVQEYLRTAGTTFAALMRDALTAYLADRAPTGPLPPALPPADRADSLSSLGEQLALLRARVEALEQVLTGRRPSADKTADRTLTGADTSQVEGCPPFDPARHYLGKLCPRRHEWGTTGQSLLRRSNQGCRQCDNEQRRAKRAARHQPPA